MASKNYRDLIVWQKAMDVVVDVYRMTSEFPSTERYGLASQMQRAAASIPSNIAEGQGRTSDKEFQRFLSIANGSRCELETQIMLSSRLNYIENDMRSVLLERSEEIGRLLTGLSKSLQR
ncbi:MAG: four helix bundle protein [Planctomycetes bacterium]|nr:four helix bundle protein [Planctomycetota bacterium]